MGAAFESTFMGIHLWKPQEKSGTPSHLIVGTNCLAPPKIFPTTIFPKIIIFASRVSGRGNVFGPVRPSVRLSVNTLTAEPFDMSVKRSFRQK